MKKKKESLNKALRDEVLRIFNALYGDAGIEKTKDNISLEIIDFISFNRCMDIDYQLFDIFDSKVKAYIKRKDENTRLLLLKGLITNGYIDIDHERIHMRYLPYLQKPQGDDEGPYITVNPNKQYRTNIKISGDKKTITLLPNNLIVKATSHDGENYNIFYVPKYLIKHNNLINIPKGIFLVPYDYFNQLGIPTPNHIRIMIMRISANQARVVVGQISEYLIQSRGLNNNISLEIMKQEILKQSSFKPEVYFDEYGMWYEIDVIGSTVSEIISKAVEFNSEIIESISSNSNLVLKETN